MEKTASERFIESIGRANEAFIKISANTFFSTNELEDASYATKALWIADKDIIDSFRSSFQMYQIDKKYMTVKTLNDDFTPDQNQKSGVTIKGKLIERKNILEEAVAKIKEEEALLESTITTINLKCLKDSHVQVPDIKQLTI